MKNLLILSCLLFTAHTFATAHIVWNTTIDVYVQSTTSGSAHMIESANGIYNGAHHPVCGYRAYIDVADKELLSMALSASVSEQTVSFIYDDAADEVPIIGHGVNRCKVISIFKGNPKAVPSD